MHASDYGENDKPKPEENVNFLIDDIKKSEIWLNEKKEKEIRMEDKKNLRKLSMIT